MTPEQPTTRSSHEEGSRTESTTVPLASGQLWQFRGGYIEIKELGTKQVHYRILWRKGQGGGLTRVMKINALHDYLKSNEAMLVS